MHGIRRVGLGLLACTIASVPLLGARHVAAASGPFVCQPGFYQVISGQLNQLNPTNGVYTAIGPVNPTYNAMGYNIGDNYLYALSTAGGSMGHLLRVASDGSITDLGLPAGLPAGSYVAGDVDNANHLIIRSSAATWYSIDLTTVVATPLTVTGANVGNDTVWIGGVMYLLNGTILYRVDLSTLTATNVNVTGVVSGSFGAAWSDNPNELFFSDNTTGHIYEVAGFTGATPSGTLVVSGAITGNNDGAACKSAGSPFIPPAAVDDSYSTLVNQPLVVAAGTGVLANDTGTSLSAGLGTGTTHGSLTLNADGSFTYTPTAGYIGPDSFTYTATDPYGRSSAPATVSLTVTPPAPPVASNDAYGTPANSALTRNAAQGVLVNDTGTSLTATLNAGPTHGTATLNGDGSFLYTPTAGYSGPDGFTYVATDPYAQSSGATATITVTPVAVADTYTTAFQTALTRSAAQGVLANDAGSGLAAVLDTGPAHGSLTLNGDGSFTYTPSAGYTGPDSFTYHANDGTSSSNAVAVTLAVSPPGAPVANNDAYSTISGVSLSASAGTGVLANDSGTSLTASVLSAPTHGTVTLHPDGSFSYTPSQGFSGHDSYTYTAQDPSSQSSVATVSIVVAPIAAPGGATVNTGVTTPVPLPAPTGSGPFTYTLVTPPLAADGAATLDPSTGVLSFTPASGFSGPVPPFTYSVQDGASVASAPATITIVVRPTAQPASRTGPQGVPITVTPPPPAGVGPFTYALVVSSLPPAVDGTVTINPQTGAITFTPTPSFIGSFDIQYTVTDGSGGVSAPARVHFGVAGVSASVPSTGTDMWQALPLAAQLVVFGVLLIILGRRRRQRAAR